MKKVMVMLLAAVFLFTAAIPAALAAPPDSKGLNRVKVEKEEKVKIEKRIKFKDVKGHWAESTLLEMNAKGFIKGYEDETFKPRNVVSKMEATVMLVRALGWEDEAEKAELEVYAKHAKQIPSWATGYVQVAYEKGILTEGDLQSFRPNQGAKRIEIATMITRALQLDKKINSKISLKFIDKKDIPEDLNDVVRLMVETGIMKGTPGNCFLPNKPITRAEMAVLLGRIDGTAVDITLREVRGIISEVDEDSITVKKGSWTREFQWADDVDVYLDGKDADIEDMEKGFRVKLVLNKQGEVTYVKASSPSEEESIFEGKITQIVVGDNQKLTIKSGRNEYTFDVDSSTEIEKDGKELFLAELEIGWEVKVEVQGDLALEITVQTDGDDEEEEQNEFEGTITEVDTGSTPSITIKDEDGEEYTFDVTEDTKIYLNDYRKILEDLKVGYEVEIMAEGDEAVRIEAEKVTIEYEGEILSITLGEDAAITIEAEDEEEYTFDVTDDTRIRLDGVKTTLNKLQPGDEVEIEVDGNEVVKIKAERD